MEAASTLRIKQDRCTETQTVLERDHTSACADSVVYGFSEQDGQTTEIAGLIGQQNLRESCCDPSILQDGTAEQRSFRECRTEAMDDEHSQDRERHDGRPYVPAREIQRQDANPDKAARE